MWDWRFAAQVFPEILSVLWITISATIVGFMLAMVLGLVLAIMRRSKNKVFSWPVIGFIEFIRSTPLLVQIFFIYYALPMMSGIYLSAFTAGALALGIHYSTYCSEIYRSGIDAVNRSQWEAATALNFTTLQKWTRVILPQAIPPVIPMLGNYLIAMFKDTPLLAAISLVEILMKAKIIGSESFRYVEPFTIVGLLFLVLSYSSAILLKRLEDRLNQKYR
jgi:polar amino acid transport system permease protein